VIKLIGIDIDGTLLDSRGHVLEENALAIRDAVAAGITVVLVTGRSYPWARPVAETLPPSVTLIVSNGAVERAPDGTTLSRSLLPREVARLALERTRGSRGSTAVIFDRDSPGQIVFESMDWTHHARRGYFERNERLIVRVASLEGALTEDPVQVMFNGGVSEMRTLAGELRGLPGSTLAVTEYVERDFTLLDLTSSDATKGKALGRRAAALGLARHETMAIGDNFNDIDMLESVGTPVVMGNAVPELKARGWPVTGHQDEAGLATAIRTFALARV
jgi:Cof subfamily protein (haloacid dehalogenase superfamily)